MRSSVTMGQSKGTMMWNLVNKFVDLVSQHGLIGVVVLCGLGIFYLLYVLIDEDRSAAWRARIYKLFYKFTGSLNAEKKYIENDISSRLNLARREMPFGIEYCPKAVKIEWVETGRTGTAVYLNDNEYVIRLSPYDAQEKNIVLIARTLVNQTALVGLRAFLEKPIESAIDLNLVKALLDAVGNRRILDWYLDHEYLPKMRTSKALAKWNEKIEVMDERGLFTRLLLVELDEFAKRVAGRRYSPEFSTEIKDLIDFIYKIAAKAYRSHVPLSFPGRYIKIGVILVGTTEKILAKGISPYVKAIFYQLEWKPTAIYVVQWDKEFLSDENPELYRQFMEFVEKLRSEIEQIKDLKKDFTLRYQCLDPIGNKRKAIISRYIPTHSLG